MGTGYLGGMCQGKGVMGLTMEAPRGAGVGSGQPPRVNLTL